jgi:cytochrome b6-f complex iron-sulfur subunit
MSCTRRDVLYTIGLAATTTAIGCTGTSGSNVPAGTGALCGSDLCFKLSDNSALATVGGMLLFTAAGKEILVQRISDTELLALSAECTHDGCNVDFDGRDRFTCPCHGSAFELDGTVINGPAQRPLDEFATTIAGDDVTISLS